MMRKSILTCLVLSAAWTACSGTTASTVPSANADSDAGADAVSLDGADNPHASPPDKPAVQNAGGGVELIVAINELGLGDKAGDAGVGGYDLDKTFTCQGEGDSCAEPSWASGDHYVGESHVLQAHGHLS
jgi:hypothetical protein